jgi:hypothetical protein
MNIENALRSAADPVSARVTSEPARELLEQIVRSDRQAAPAPVPHRRRRLAVAGVTGALAAACAIALTLVNIGPAYASWTPDPTPLPADLAQRIVAECVPAQERGAARVVIGETRGDYAFLNAVTPGWSRTCFRDQDGTVRESAIHADPVRTEQLGADGVELYSWSQLRTEEGYVRLMAGNLGSQVVGVDIAVRGRDGGPTRTVHASVRGGYFAAWYPEGAEEANTNTTTLTLRLAGGGRRGDLSAGQLLTG